MEQGLANILRSRRKEIEITEARPAAEGDALVVDFIGRIGGEAFEGGTAQDVPVEIGGAGFIPGFAEQLAGQSVGETRTISVRFPEEYGSAELAGKDAEFEVTAKALKQYRDAGRR